MDIAKYLVPLDRQLHKHANADDAVAMAKYMRDLFPFFGIKMPQRKQIFRDFLAEEGLPPVDSVEEVVWAMWQKPQREYHYLALMLLDKMRRKLEPETIHLLEKLVVNNSWWDTVDALASQIGFHFQRFPPLQEPSIERWRRSDNFWLRRITLLFQLKYKEATDVALLFSLIEENRQSDEFFIQKAIGWALRQYSKTDAAAVREFVARTELAPLSEREALKWLARQKG